MHDRLLTMGGKDMIDFLLCVVQYVLIGVVTLAIGIAGAMIGIRLRKNKNAKLAAESTDNEA